MKTVQTEGILALTAERCCRWKMVLDLFHGLITIQSTQITGRCDIWIENMANRDWVNVFSNSNIFCKTALCYWDIYKWYAFFHLNIKMGTILKYSLIPKSFSTCDSLTLTKQLWRTRKCYKVRAYCQEAFTAFMLRWEWGVRVSQTCMLVSVCVYVRACCQFNSTEFPKQGKTIIAVFFQSTLIIACQLRPLLNHRPQAFVTIWRKSPWHQNTIPSKGKCVYYTSHSSVTRVHF